VQLELWRSGQRAIEVDSVKHDLLSRANRRWRLCVGGAVFRQRQLDDVVLSSTDNPSWGSDADEADRQRQHDD
jgi:hypothetical protein